MGSNLFYEKNMATSGIKEIPAFLERPGVFEIKPVFILVVGGVAEVYWNFKQKQN